MSDNPAVEVAKERRADEAEGGVVTLSTGVRARLLPVAASLLDEVRARVPVPKVPIWHNPNTERDEENPNDPAYTRALAEHVERVGVAAIDAIVLFGVELADGVPDDTRWLKKLARLGIDVDADDPDEVEFAFKKFVAVASPDIMRIAEMSGVSGAAVERAAASFRR